MALQRYPAYSAGFNARGKSPGMNTIHREVIDIHQNELVETMETRTVVRELLTQGMLGDFHCQQLEYVYPEGRIVANRLLLAFVRKQVLYLVRHHGYSLMRSGSLGREM